MLLFQIVIWVPMTQASKVGGWMIETDKEVSGIQ